MFQNKIKLIIFYIKQYSEFIERINKSNKNFYTFKILIYAIKIIFTVARVKIQQNLAVSGEAVSIYCP